MGTRIFDQTPRGSAMSAYGTARGLRWNVPLLALVAGSLVLVAALFFLFMRMAVPLPDHTLLLVAARPAALNTLVTLPALKRDLPAPWRAVLETNSHFPVLFGVALDSDRTPHAFAIAPKTAFLGNPPGLIHTRHGAYSLLSSVPLSVRATPLRDLPVSVGTVFRYDASFALRGDLLEAWAFPAPFMEDPRASIRGTWNDGVGRVAIPSEPATEMVAVDASLFSVVRHATDDFRPSVVAGLLSQGVDLRNTAPLPTVTTLSVSPLGNRALTLTWPDALSARDRAQLPEATTLLDGRRFTFLDTATTTQEANIPPSSIAHCPGTPRFALEGSALVNFLHFIHAPDSLLQLMTGFRAHQQGETLFLCVH